MIDQSWKLFLGERLGCNKAYITPLGENSHIGDLSLQGKKGMRLFHIVGDAKSILEIPH